MPFFAFSKVSFSYNIVAADTPTGCAFEYTIDDFVENYNNYLSQAVSYIKYDSIYKDYNVDESQLNSLDEFAKQFMITSMDDIKFERTESHDNSLVDCYYLSDKNIGIGFYIDSTTGYIVQLNYIYSNDYFSSLPTAQQIFLRQSLSEFICASIGFSRANVFEDCINSAGTTGSTVIKQGASFSVNGQNVLESGTMSTIIYIIAEGESEK